MGDFGPTHSGRLGSPMTKPSGPGTYCGTLTDEQVRNVLAAEKERMANNPKGGPVHDGAVELYNEARTELVHRGLMHPSEK